MIVYSKAREVHIRSVRPIKRCPKCNDILHRIIRNKSKEIKSDQAFYFIAYDFCRSCKYLHMYEKYKIPREIAYSTALDLYKKQKLDNPNFTLSSVIGLVEKEEPEQSIVINENEKWLQENAKTILSLLKKHKDAVSISRKLKEIIVIQEMPPWD